jgi:hypothetical protein
VYKIPYRNYFLNISLVFFYIRFFFGREKYFVDLL